MLPAYDTDLIEAYELKRYPSRTYAIDTKRNCISGMIDQYEAMKQAIDLILATERYQWEIYSWNYGIERNRLIGEDIPYVYILIQKMISDALLQDDRILSVSDFVFGSDEKNEVTASFKVQTIFGDIDERAEVVI